VSGRFDDPLRLKAVIVPFIAYVLLSVIAVAIAVQLLLPRNLTPEQMRALADTLASIRIAEIAIGIVLTLFAGALAAKLGGNRGYRNSTAVGVVLVFWGLLGIYLHPLDPLWLQAAKIVAPVPLALLGAALWLHFRRAPAEPGPGHNPERTSVGR